MFTGTFEQAREAAKTENKWLLVNIQSQTEFDALRLNRDCWSDDVVQVRNFKI
jgi:UBX domain-containing protein 7